MLYKLRETSILKCIDKKGEVMPIFFKKTKLFNVRMMIKEEKILSNINKVKKLINPNSKKQIIKLEEDSYFKDLMESITNFLIEYPNKTAFPSDVYKSAYDLVEYATLQFENNNNQIAKLMSEREENIKTSYMLREALETVSEKQEGWVSRLSRYEGKFDKNISEGLSLIANSQDLEDENVRTATKMIETKISNLESNLFIEIDIERIEDRSKALSSIGIELADSLKTIPAPIERVVANVSTQNITNVEEEITTDELRSFEDNKEAIIDEINRLKISENQKRIEEEKEKIELKEKLEEIDMSGMYNDDNIDFEDEKIDEKDEVKDFEEKIKANMDNDEKSLEEEKEPTEDKKVEVKDEKEIEMDLAEIVEDKISEKVHVLNLDDMLEEENTKLEHVSMAETENSIKNIENLNTDEEKLIKESTKEVKPSFFKRVWNAIRYMFKVKVVLDLPSNTENENS